jgi:hypothetical protein
VFCWYSNNTIISSCGSRSSVSCQGIQFIDTVRHSAVRSTRICHGAQTTAVIFPARGVWLHHPATQGWVRANCTYSASDLFLESDCSACVPKDSSLLPAWELFDSLLSSTCHASSLTHCYRRAGRLVLLQETLVLNPCYSCWILANDSKKWKFRPQKS